MMMSQSVLALVALLGTRAQGDLYHDVVAGQQPLSAAALVCGKPGWGSTTFYARHNGMPLAKCREVCVADRQCQAYSDDQRGETGNCYLYRTPVDKTPVVSYPQWAMYDRGCAQPNCGIPGWGSTTYYKSFGGMPLAKCKETCLADAQCQSYSDNLRGKTGNCYLYRTAVKDTPFGPYPDWAMYDRGCGTVRPQCGVAGWGSTTYYKLLSGMPLAACKATCLSDPTCKAYSDDMRGQTGNCYLYTTPVKDTPTTAYPNWAMYDRMCGVAEPQCGVPGWGSATHYSVHSGMPLARCKETCLADPACQAYSDDFRGHTGNCYLYATPVRDTPTVAYPSWSMYDRACPATIPQCAVPGWASTTHYKSVAGMPLAKCNETCLADAECRSYSDDVRGETGNCYLYKTAVKDTPFGPYPHWGMYDRGCVAGHRPERPQCAVPGWGSTTYYKLLPGLPLDKCRETCLAESECKAYSDDMGGWSGSCYLYRTAVKDTTFAPYPNWGMYDRGCGKTGADGEDERRQGVLDES
ncbi:Apple-like protein [Metarhizium album ARSEF 1941]|uniref:Apple-like protein n=1 Tax=Metarhizium album (strain ARSEF 1941) TaxID=1081103 RepID=A0A0B2WJX9_METAS|nr:Apple-like protein [Metarhizium album ARSEF 1941]KHN96346.1 Apple-like protein [Metarhizium album ARSEF 1941]